MPKPRAGADPSHSRRSEKKSSQPSQDIARSSSDRLHLALLVALGAVTLVAVAFPLTRYSASAEVSSGTPVLVVSEGLAAALHSQAQTVVSALAQAGPVATPEASREVSALSGGLDGFPGGGLVPRPILLTAARVLMRGALADAAGQQGLALELQRPVGFTLYEGGFASVVFSTRPTVGGALAALGAGYNRFDIISPPPDTSLTAGLHVFLRRATAVRLAVGGEVSARVYTHSPTVADLLAERGIELVGGDFVTPGPAAHLRDGLSISVTVVRETAEVEDTPISFRTIYRNDPSLPLGEYRVVQEGADGYVRREYAVVYENGREISRELLSEAIVPPTHRVIAQGTAVVAAAVVAAGGDVQCARTMNVWATWYTAASAGGSGYTATGTTVRKGTVAVDPRVIPLGTRMYIPGYGYGVAEDTGGAVVGNIIDLGYGPNDAKDWRSGWVTICILS